MNNADPSQFPIHELPAAQRNEQLRADTQTALSELKLLLGASASAQQEITEFRARYDRLPESTPLAPRSLRAIRNGRSTYLQLQSQLIELAQRYAPLAPLDDKALGELLLDRGLAAKAVLISFVAALILYDNHLSMRIVLEDSRLRRLMGNPGRGYNRDEDEIVEFLRDLNSADKQDRLEQLAQAYDRVEETLSAANDPDIGFLQMAVASSAAYCAASEAILEKHLPSRPQLWRERIFDALDGFGKRTVGTISELFGNGVGLIETRKGKLWQDEALEQTLTQMLQPLDLLLEKTPFRLTDKFIPGHFGHVAVWVGSAEELAELGIFNEPMFQQAWFATCEAQVAEGRSVLEALRTGVQLSTLAEFLNVDDLAILRPQGLTPAEKRDSLIRAFRQLGKQYDFNFEVQTLDKITCSELPYHVFPDVGWETEEQLGQHTISPDQIAYQALSPEAPLDLMAFCHDGTFIEPADALPLMKDLLDIEQA